MTISRAIVIACCAMGLAESIVTSRAESKVTSKSTENTKKSDQLEAQASQNHGIYGGFGDNSLGGFGGSGFGGGFGGDVGGYGGGFGGYDDHHKHHGHHHDHHDHHHEHHDHHDSYHKALAIKGLLVPLAGVALLGAAAAFVSNPILLQLGVISGTYGRRRRRDTEHEIDIDESAAKLEAQARLGQIKVLERFMAQVPKEQMFSQEKKLMANYLSCSGTTEEACLERLACELHGPSANVMPEETRVMSIVTKEIFDNELVPFKTKERMSEAVRRGREGEDCSVYRCTELESLMKQKEE